MDQVGATSRSDRAPAGLDFDAVVVGAGMSGLYALKLLREQGLRVVALEKGAGVGGTWYWNRYPGCRCDVPSLEYSFGFDPELEQEWVWTEHFASQPEIERYLNHIADRYDLRRDIRLECPVVSAAVFDEASGTAGPIETGDGGQWLRTRFVRHGDGRALGAEPAGLPRSLERFEGTVLQTSLWPEHERGARGEARRHHRNGLVRRAERSPSSREVPPSHLTVFQRTPTFTWPSHNKPLGDDEQAEVKARVPRAAPRAAQRPSPGSPRRRRGRLILASSPTDGRKILESTPGGTRRGDPRARLSAHAGSGADTEQRPRGERDGRRALPRGGSAHDRRTPRSPSRSLRAATRSAASDRSSTRSTSRPSTATTSRWSTCARAASRRSRRPACAPRRDSCRST